MLIICYMKYKLLILNNLLRFHLSRKWHKILINKTFFDSIHVSLILININKLPGTLIYRFVAHQFMTRRLHFHGEKENIFALYW